MSKHSARSATRVFLLSTLLLLGASGVMAQPPEAAAAIPIAELTGAQYESLADEQLISSGENQISLGELRAQQAERRAASEAAVAAGAKWAKAELMAERDELAAGAAERSSADRQQVEALMAHFKRLAAANPEMVRRARALSAQRREVHKLWLQSGEADTAGELKRIERKLRKIQRSSTPPGG